MSNGDYAVGEIGGALEPYLNKIAIEMVNTAKVERQSYFYLGKDLSKVL